MQPPVNYSATTIITHLYVLYVVRLSIKYLAPSDKGISRL